MKTNNIIKIISLCLCITTCFYVFSFNGKGNAAETDSQDKSEISAGDNIEWEFSEGVLTLSGEGRMNDFLTENYYFEGITTNVPWKDYLQSIRTVEFKGNITYIGNCSFADCGGLTKVSFPTALNGIGENAFARCSSLIKAEIPDSVKTMGNGTFIGCQMLKTIKLPSQLTAIPNDMFSGCMSLSKVSIPESVKEIGNSAFKVCKEINEIELPDNLTKLGYAAFFGCASLKTIVIPDGVKIIDNQTFQLCSALSKVVLPENIEEIKYSAFAGCGLLKEAVIPYSVNRLSKRAFYGCSSLKSVTIYNPLIDLRDSEIFRDTSADINFFSYKNSSVQTYCEENGFSFNTISGESFEASTDKQEYSYDGASKGDDLRIHVPENIEGLRIRYDNSGKANIDGGFYSIALLAKYNRLRNSDNFLVQPGNYEFYYFLCGKGTEVFTGKVNIEIKRAEPVLQFDKEEMTVLLNNTFTNKLKCSTDQEIVYGTSDSSIAEVDGKGKVTPKKAGECLITAVAKENDRYISKSCSYLLKIKEHEYTISENKAIITAYYGEDENVEIPAKLDGYTVTGIGDKAFFKRSKIKTVSLPDTVTRIGDSAFDECTNLESVSLPDTMTSIGKGAFQYCYSLPSVRIPKGITEIEDCTFLACGHLTDIEFCNDVKTIGLSAFGGCNSLNNVVMNHGLEEIKSGAFSYCTNLKSVTMPKSVRDIGEGAFYRGLDATGDLVVNYYGDKSDWKKINISYRAFEYDTDPVINYIVLFGDVNNDGTVDSKDRVLLTRYLARWKGYEDIGLSSADLNNDSKVNTKDRIILARHIAGWKGYETLPLN